MARSAFTSLLATWSAAFLGCAMFLLVGLFPRSPLSAALLGQVGWLALLGSVPSALVLAAAARVANGSRGLLAGTSATLALLALAAGWEHTEFLLSGPRWAVHSQRDALRLGLGASFGVTAAAGWVWLVAGYSRGGRISRSAWTASGIVLAAALTFLIARHRAYDYSMAQLVFPGGLLLSAVIARLIRVSGHQRSAAWFAALLAMATLATRLDADLIATGEREVIAHSRAGSLVTLHVLPRLSQRYAPSADSRPCVSPLPTLEPATMPIEPTKRRNVIVVSVDALRRDVVGMVHGKKPVTPALSKLEREGVSFVRATTTYPATLFAVGSAFTGLSPAELYLSPALPETVFTRSRSRVDRQIVVLPNVSWFRLPIVGELFAPGVDPAFADSDAAATETLIAELRAARQDGASIMAWVHYYSPHDPYQQHPDFPFGRGRKNAYLSEVAYFDAQLGSLMSYLEQDGWFEDTLLVFFSDHGEALGEQSYFGHHVYLDSWMSDVPLVLRHDGLPPAEALIGASVADIAPTILHFLGLPQPSDVAARSLLALDPKRPDRASFSEAFPVRGQALFDSFRLPALDDETIRERLRSIRVANKGYEPKGSVRLGDDRLIHHRSADARFVSNASGASVDAARAAELQGALDAWERAQLRRIECRLRLKATPPASAAPR